MSKRSLFLDSAREHGQPVGAGFAPAPTVEQLLGLPPVKPPPADKPYLDNRLGVSDLSALVPMEAAITASTIPQALARMRNRTSWGLKELRLIHATIFRPIYPWAGKIRQSDIAKNGDVFESFSVIPKRMSQLIDRLEQTYADGQNLIEGLKQKSQDQVADTLAHLYHGVCWIHPFREGNGRTMRTFCAAIARQTGFDLQWNRLDFATKNAFDKTCSKPFSLTENPLAPYFRQVIVQLEAKPVEPTPRRMDNVVQLKV